MMDTTTGGVAAGAANSTSASASSMMIVSPSSSINPIPSLPTALRVDNQEQLTEFLLSSPSDGASGAGTVPTKSKPIGATGATATSVGLDDTNAAVRRNNFKQIFVFGTNSIRTLIMRQVLNHPEQVKTAVAAKVMKKKNNWDTAYTYPDISKQYNLLGTRVLKQQQQQPSRISSNENTIPGETSTIVISMEEIWKNDGLYGNIDVENVVITYFLRPYDYEQTQLAIYHMKLWKQFQQQRKHTPGSTVGAGGSSNASRRKGPSSQQYMYHNHYHRFLYLPQITTIIKKLHVDLGLVHGINNVIIHQLQLDIFPLENDVLSLEYDDTIKEDNVDETPSTIITVAARSLLKLQDIVGRLSRIQSYGPIAEEVVKKLLHITIDEYIQEEELIENDNNNDNTSNLPVRHTSGMQPTPVECNSNTSEVAALVVIDRKIDFATPLVTTLTYEGLLDEVIGIDCGYIVVPVKTINPDGDNKGGSDDASSNASSLNSPSRKTNYEDNANTLVELGVNGSDTLYAEVRNQHVEKFGSFLQNQARALQQSHANFTDKNKKKELSEIHQFVKQMPIFTQNLRSLTNHIHLAELIKKTSEDVLFRERWQLERTILEGEVCYDIIDDLIAMQYPPYKLLAIICLQSICSGGIKSSRYETMKRDIVQTYGYEYIFLLSNLEKAGLLRKRDGLWIDTASPFGTLRKSLILINAEVDTVEPDDISYVSSGYAPLTVRIIQTAMKGWAGREDILRELPGKFIDITQYYPPEDLATARKRRPSTPNLSSHATAYQSSSFPESSADNQSSSLSTTTPTKKPVLIVFYIGGVTYMEIAALRFLSKRSTFPYHIMCLTTKIINGVSMIQSLVPSEVNNITSVTSTSSSMPSLPGVGPS